MDHRELFQRVLAKLRKTPPVDVDELVRETFPPDLDERPWRVMISSPVTGLKDARKTLKESLSAFRDLDVDLFDAGPDSGQSNVAESLEKVNRCDLFVALFDPKNPGSEILDKSQMPPGFNGAHFCDLEIWWAMKRQNEDRWPRIFIYEREYAAEDGHVVPSADTWHARYKEITAAKNFADPDQLVDKVHYDVLGTALEIRARRARSLVEDIRRLREDLTLASERLEHKKELVEHVRSDAAAQRKELLQSHELRVEDLKLDATAQREQLTESHERAMAASLRENEHVIRQLREERDRLAGDYEAELSRVRASHQAETQDLQGRHRVEMDTLGAQLTALGSRMWQGMIRGAIAAAAPMLLLALMMLVWFLRGNVISGDVKSGNVVPDDLAGSIEQAANLVASAAAYRPVHVSSIALDPMLLAAKIRLAQTLTGGAFDCEGSPDQLVAVTSLGNSSTVFMRRDSVCFSYGPFVLEGEGPDLESCDFRPVIARDWWKRFETAVQDSSPVSIAGIRLIGHASAQPIHLQCPQLAPEWLPGAEVENVRALRLDDRKIQTNTQLAYVRARVVQREIQEVSEDLPVTSETIGILAPPEAGRSGRRVSIAIELNGHPHESGKNVAMRTQSPDTSSP